jgi:hypothetical protein
MERYATNSALRPPFPQPPSGPLMLIAIRWPLPRGEVRDIPADAKIHCSVIERLNTDEDYRPGNLIMLGTGGRGHRVAPKEMGKGEWVSWQNTGDPVSEIFVSKKYADEVKEKEDAATPAVWWPKGWSNNLKKGAAAEKRAGSKSMM